MPPEKDGKGKDSKEQNLAAGIAIGAAAATAAIAAAGFLYSLFKKKEAEPVANPESSESSAVKKGEEGSSPAECCVCMAEAANCLFLPCRHLKTCMACSPKIARCPVCRSEITAREGPVYL